MVPLILDRPLTTSLVSVLAQGRVCLRLTSPRAYGHDAPLVLLPGASAEGGVCYSRCCLPSTQPALDTSHARALLHEGHSALRTAEPRPVALRRSGRRLWVLILTCPWHRQQAGGQSHPCPLKQCQLCPSVPQSAVCPCSVSSALPAAGDPAPEGRGRKARRGLAPPGSPRVTAAVLHPVLWLLLSHWPATRPAPTSPLQPLPGLSGNDGVSRPAQGG